MAAVEEKSALVAQFEARWAQENAVRKEAWERERRMFADIDVQTRVPHLLIEIRSLGYVEIQGKNVGGIYEKLDAWLKRKWRVKKLDQQLVPIAEETVACGCCKGLLVRYEPGELDEWNRLCDASYIMGSLTGQGIPSGNGVYKAQGSHGENNMGKLTMQLVDFMTHECGWTFQTCDAGNLGSVGQMREQQVKFKAPHPLNLVAPLVMIELRQVGFVEINGADTNGIYSLLADWLQRTWGARKVDNDPDYCDLKFATNVFKRRGSEGENNMGMRTMELVDFMVQECCWTMVTCNTGNFGRTGQLREQQLVFRNHEFVRHGSDHFMVELRQTGYVEVNGLQTSPDIRPKLDSFMKDQWDCRDYKPYMWETDEKFCDRKYTVPRGFYHRQDRGLTNNLGRLTMQMANCFADHGWALLLCNGGSIKNTCREQQIKFTRAKSIEAARVPLLMVEFRTVPYSDRPPRYKGVVEVNGADTNGVYRKLDEFVCRWMGGVSEGPQAYCDRLYSCPCFTQFECCAHPRGKTDGYLNGESDIGRWTMRLCDFLVDQVGEWDLIVCNSDNLEAVFKHSSGSGDKKKEWTESVTAREMQMVFQHRPKGRAVFMSSEEIEPLGRPPLEAPQYWTEAAIQGIIGKHFEPVSAEEMGWAQELLDSTFKHKATRDRRDGQPLPDRLLAVSCLRSEQPALWDRYARRRAELALNSAGGGGDGSSPLACAPRTTACGAPAGRCLQLGAAGNPANEAYLFHGTHPTMAMAILGRSFTVDAAGKSAGTMFGPGVYLAESSTKADEYARHDEGGEYAELYAMLLCRVALGRPFVTQEAGNFMDKVLSGEFGHVLGDRETAVGTFREFVLFHEESIFPEYAIFYRRQCEGRVIQPIMSAEPPIMEEMLPGAV